MKKLTAVILSLIMLLSFASCGSDKSSSSDSGSDSGTETSGLEVEKKILNVTITMPASFFSEKTEEEIKSDAEENGYKSCTINEDGSVTYVMSKSVYNEKCDELYEEFEKSCQEMVDDTEDNENITNIEYNKDISKVNVYLDADISTSPGLFTSYTFLLYGSYYQSFLGYDQDDIDVAITYYDDANGEVLSSVSLKELQSENSESTTAETTQAQ